MACNNDRALANNPVLMRITDKKFITIEDNAAGSYCGDMDAVFIDSAVKIRPGRSSTDAGNIGANLKGGSAYQYSFIGRRLGEVCSKGCRTCGIVIGQIIGENRTLSKMVIVP